MAKNSVNALKNINANKVYRLGTSENFTFDSTKHDGITLILPTSYAGTLTNTGMAEGQKMTLYLITGADPASWIDYPALTAAQYSVSGKIEIQVKDGKRYAMFPATNALTGTVATIVYTTATQTLTSKTVSTGTIKNAVRFTGISSTSAVSAGIIYKLASGYLKIKA